MSRSKQKGTAAESAVAQYLKGHGFPLAERRALSGNKDRGDISGVAGIVIEVKATISNTPGAWLAEAEAERLNARADYGVVVHKPRGIGMDRAGSFHVLMTLETFCRMAPK